MWQKGHRNTYNVKTSYVQLAGYMLTSLGFCFSKSIIHIPLTTCPYFDNLVFDIFNAMSSVHLYHVCTATLSRLYCHFITSVTNAVRIRTLSIH